MFTRYRIKRTIRACPTYRDTFTVQKQSLGSLFIWRNPFDNDEKGRFVTTRFANNGCGVFYSQEDATKARKLLLHQKSYAIYILMSGGE